MLPLSPVPCTPLVWYASLLALGVTVGLTVEPPAVAVTTTRSETPAAAPSTSNSVNSTFLTPPVCAKSIVTTPGLLASKDWLRCRCSAF